MHTLQLHIDKLPVQIDYQSNLLLIGSCFADNMAGRFMQHKFNVLSNPHGTLFNPLSVANSLDSYVQEITYTDKEMFFLNEIWNSWEHHSDFSDIDKHTALERINDSQKAAAAFIKTATHIVITLGSSFYYHNIETDKPVSNNHRAPAQLFEKRLLTVQQTVDAFTNTLEGIWKINPGTQVIFTVSPVRHIRDGVVDNNRSKARLIDAVHELCNKFENAYYFPAYELVIDILRDYRYYDIDFVHPNYLATDFVWKEFVSACMTAPTQSLMKELNEISIAQAHRPRFPQTDAHKKFRQSYVQKIRALIAQYPYLQLGEELKYFED